MLVKEPSYRHKLSSEQIGLLKVLFKFRFVSTELLAGYLDRDKSTIYERLYVLGNQGYTAKLYDKNYRFRGRPATHCLAAAGIRYLLDNSDLDPVILRGMYRNQSYSEAIIDRHLLVMKLYLVFEKLYGQQFELYTKTELTKTAWFLRPLPELYLETKDHKQASLLLEIVEAGLPSWQLRRRLWKHVDYADDEWNEAKYGAYPSLLLIATNDRTEQRLL